jgi:hypothetical protein
MPAAKPIRKLWFKTDARWTGILSSGGGYYCSAVYSLPNCTFAWLPIAIVF